MKISLKCFAKLSEANVCDFRDGDEREISPAETVRSVVQQLGFQPDDVKVIFVNGKIAELDTVLRDGDRLGLAPAEGGM